MKNFIDYWQLVHSSLEIFLLSSFTVFSIVTFIIFQLAATTIMAGPSGPLIFSFSQSNRFYYDLTFSPIDFTRHNSEFSHQ